MLLYQSYQWMHAMDNIRLRKKLVKSFSQIRVAVTQCGNCGNYWHTFLTKRVDLTNFFWGDSEFFSTLWVNFSFVHTAKIFRQIDLHYNSLVKKLIWRNFCKQSRGKNLQISTPQCEKTKNSVSPKKYFVKSTL